MEKEPAQRNKRQQKINKSIIMHRLEYNNKIVIAYIHTFCTQYGQYIWGFLIIHVHPMVLTIKRILCTCISHSAVGVSSIDHTISINETSKMDSIQQLGSTNNNGLYGTNIIIIVKTMICICMCKGTLLANCHFIVSLFVKQPLPYPDHCYHRVAYPPF